MPSRTLACFRGTNGELPLRFFILMLERDGKRTFWDV